MKKFLLILILILIVVSCLFPPWQRIWYIPSIFPYKDGGAKKNYFPVGYGFIVTPPKEANTIDFGRLGIQLGLLVFLGSCIVFSKYIFPETQPKPKPALSDEIPPKKNCFGWRTW